MSKRSLAVGLALLATCSQLAFAQIQSTATGGAGGQGGSASGGSASGGSAMATGGTTSSKGGSGGTASGGAANAQGGSVTGVSTGSINSSGTGNSQSADITVNYIQPSTTSPTGIKGLAAGVDPETNHFVNDNNVRYSGSQTIKNTPDVGVGGPASGPCNGLSGGIGVALPGFAIGANASTVDKGCEARETARVAAMLGRMDIANAVLEHIAVVEEAMRAKAERDAARKAAMSGAAPAKTAPAQEREQPQQQRPSEADLETARLAEQQKLASAALQRKATMDKVNDTITFTTSANQETTPQQTMAEEATKQQADLVARAEKQALESAGGVQAPTAIASSGASPSRQSPNSVSAPPPASASAAPAASAAPPQAQAGNAGTVVAAAAASGGAPVPQSQQIAKSPASVEPTNGGQANGTATSVAAAQPNVSDDQVRKLLGFNAAPAPNSTASSSVPDDRPTKVAATLPGAKAHAPSGPNGSGNPAAKSQPVDPTGIAKVLLNVR